MKRWHHPSFHSSLKSCSKILPAANISKPHNVKYPVFLNHLLMLKTRGFLCTCSCQEKICIVWVAGIIMQSRVFKNVRQRKIIFFSSQSDEPGKIILDTFRKPNSVLDDMHVCVFALYSKHRRWTAIMEVYDFALTVSHSPKGISV